MGLAYILKRVESDTGIDTSLNPEQRENLLYIINEAATELYKSVDLALCLREVIVTVSRCKTISLPPFVGEIRAIRHCSNSNLFASSLMKMNLSNIRARYSTTQWNEKWNKFTVLQEAAIASEILTAAPVTSNYTSIDNDLQITIVGETTSSNRSVDVITQSALVTTGTKAYLNINKITKNKVTDDNVIITNAAGEEIAILYADQFESKYIIVDVSKYPWLNENGDGTFNVEVLYKMRLNKLSFDSDEFPVTDYDDIIVLKVKQLLAEDKPGDENRAILMASKANLRVQELNHDKTGPIDARIKPRRNMLFGRFPKWHTSRRYWRRDQIV